MAWDLAIADNGDIMLAANSDLGGKSGTDLLEQRMAIRMKLIRGSWVYDEAETLGSMLHTLIGLPPDKASATAPALVREALRAMSDEITVDDVRAFSDAQSVQLLVFYRVLESDPDAVAGTEQTRQLQISLPLFGGGG
jgi:hypothetical protein